jgi:hypothetical protein
MDKPVRFTIDAWIERARGLSDEESREAARRCFPSYLRLFDNFFQVYAAKIDSCAVEPCAVCDMRFPIAAQNVAFV